MWFTTKSIPYKSFTNLKVENRKGQKYLNLIIIKWISAAICAAIIILPLMTVMAIDAGVVTSSNRSILNQSFQKQPNIVNTTTITIPLAHTNAKNSIPSRGLKNSNKEISENTFNKIRSNSKAKLADIRVKHLQKERHRQHESRKTMRKQVHKVLHATAGKTTRLLEHSSAATHEQPIYGTWRTKARRPPQQLNDALAKAMQSSTEAAIAAPAQTQTSASALAPSQTPTTVELVTASRTGRILTTASVLMSDGNKQNVNVNGIESNYNNGNDYRHHVYEPLPQRSSTLNPPPRSDSHDQVLRPPRVISRQPSVVVRRQYLETPLNNNAQREELKPKPFHYPYDGALPEEFKKPEAERPEINNIQDILQHLHINGGTHKTPQLVMMPTGLHIAGSFKNLKSSGIMNFFRGKRNNKKQMQVTFPMSMPLPYQMFGGHQSAPVFAALAPSPYQPRIAMDQFYPFKPRTPNEINLLAMQQQQQHIKANHRSKKKKQKNAISTTNLLLQHSNQLPFATMLGFNSTQTSNLKHVPLNVNLDIFPVMPPNKPFYAANPYDQLKLSPSSPRPATVLRNPHAYNDYYGPAITPSAAALVYSEPHMLKPMKFPTASQVALQMPQASNVKITFPDQTSTYYHQSHQQQQQKQKNNYQHLEQHHNRPASVAAIDCGYPSMTTAMGSNASKANQLMVHLNVFPKQQRPQSAALVHSTNPFYGGNGGSVAGTSLNVNRQTIYEEESERNYSPTETVYMPKSSASELPPPVPSSTIQPHQQKLTARSDNFGMMSSFNEQTAFEPIVSKDFIDPHEPQTITLISNKLDNASTMLPYVETSRHNLQYETDPRMDTFRFPVEDLIQFQVNDAL